MEFWIISIPIGIISYLIGQHNFAGILLLLWLLDTVFGIFYLILKYGLDDCLYNDIMNRSAEELHTDKIKGKISLVLTAILYIFLFIVSNIYHI